MTEMDEYQRISKTADASEALGQKALPRPRNCGTLCPHLMDDEGFTTIAMAVAMVLTLALLFSAAQIYRLESETAAIQEVADASALAAENVVAEFMIAVRVCDAIVLSLSLLALTVLGVSVVLLCIPPTQSIASSLLDLGTKVMQARDKFAQAATEALNKLAKALPYLAAANAAAVGSANSSGDRHSYIAFAMLVPDEVDEIEVPGDEETDKVLDDINAKKDELAANAQDAEYTAQQLQEYKMAAYLADCGRAPDRCMEERAATLAGMSGADNPHYASVDAWSFGVALKRVRAYFRARAAQEAPASSSVKDQSDSYLRSIYYDYVNKILEGAFVYGENEEGAAFHCNFPLPPRNTDEMRRTALYTNTAFPVTSDGDALVMHAWPGCPNAAGSTMTGTLAEMEAGGYSECPVCHFKASDLGKIGAASTSINTGFEYHYAELAKAASDYEIARDLYDVAASGVKDTSTSLIDSVQEAMKAIGGKRIDIKPPGAIGAIAFVADVATYEVDAGLASGLVSSPGAVGPRAAIAAATLVEEPESDAGTVISSILDGFDANGNAAVGAARVVLDAWSNLLQFYAHGAESIGNVIDAVLEPIPLLSASGLGKWAAEKLGDAMEAVGLEPADLDALKPVLVNSGRVASADDGAFAQRLLSVKNGALSLANSDGSIFDDLIDEVSGEVSDVIGAAGTIELACVELPIGDIRIPIVITLPPGIVSAGQGLVGQAASGLKGLIGSVVTGQAWQ